jgi:hypothetical protein
MLKVKEAVFTACAGVVVSTALMSTPVSADEKSYIARLNDDGKYCARIKVQTAGFTTARRTKCRTIAEWSEKGYVVDVPADVEWPPVTVAQEQE